MSQPTVIIGGYLSNPGHYEDMRRVLEELTGQPCVVASVYLHDWLPTFGPFGWRWIVDKLEQTVSEVASTSHTGTVTLVAHSAGGTVGRIYLGDASYDGTSSSGLLYVSDFVTLGSPHGSRIVSRVSGLTRERGRIADGIASVNCLAVGGSVMVGDKHKPGARRRAYYSYKLHGKNGSEDGDCIVPLSSMFADGMSRYTMDGVYHDKVFGLPWYGSKEIVWRWWRRLTQGTPEQP